jgi:hypothetical protein
MDDFIKFFGGFIGVGFVMALVVVLLALSPLFILWSLNTISEQAHFGWYIPHNVWTYLATFYLLLSRAKTITTKSKKD